MSALTKAEARMGNDIARQFAHLPAPKAAEAIARHIETFWDPRMRRGLEALVAEGDDALDPLARRRRRPAGHPREPVRAGRPTLTPSGRNFTAEPGAIASAEVASGRR